MCIEKCLFDMKTINLNSGVSKHNQPWGTKFYFTYPRSDVSNGWGPQIPHTSIYHTLQIQTGLPSVLVGGDKNIYTWESNHLNKYTCRQKILALDAINYAVDLTLPEYILWVGSCRNLPTSDFLQQQTFYLCSLWNKTISMGPSKNLKYDVNLPCIYNF